MLELFAVREIYARVTHSGLAENSSQAMDALEAHLLKSKENILLEPTFQMLEE